MPRTTAGSAIVAAFLAAVTGAPAAAATCGGAAGFDAWLASFKREAAAQGVRPATIAGALDGVTFDPGIVARDRGQGVFQQSFLQFSGRMVAAYRLQKGAQLIKQYARILDRIEAEYGVPGAVIVAFWGLETDFGANIGDGNTLRALATLAWDCRRPDMFRRELLAALRIIDRGDLTPAQMRGPWAGELGQLQFLPAHYYDYGVDYDGDGRRDLLRSVPDVLASGANYLKSLGWRAGEPWLQEVRLPAELPWDQADLAILHPRSYWIRAGVTAADGATLPADGLPASLLLPMGRNGPAFLAYANFRAFLGWNRSLVYATTAAYFATRLDGAGPVGQGRAPVQTLSASEVAELQRLLAARGYDIGKVDGKLGLTTRAGVKQAQLKLGLPADSYPTRELLERLRTTNGTN
ncbi:lytic murein transglycosylase [Chelatococcus sp. SYSU_G07232]|uniref:Lytic murein transglycosylase n=1 Tax=Chelatococcus albus TaxID=3047466 RepID=A0ABT7AER9_9HYPH|nr:lytic murein transglycosylase [Chelatococcus sp. SYSU_G07232]MDJ1157344.1 lytic murein transglycosylase [Chelatococcus sp. SYSU_G07232]